MNKLTRDDIITLLKIAVFIALIIIAIKFFINLLPLIIVILIIILFADSFLKSDYYKNLKKQKKSNVKDAEIIEEKKSK